MLSLHSTSSKKISSSSVLLNFGETDATAAKNSTEYILKYGYLFNVVVCVMGIAMLPYLPSGIQSMHDELPQKTHLFFSDYRAGVRGF